MARPPRLMRFAWVAAAWGALTFVALHGVFGITWGSLFSDARIHIPWFLASRRSLIAIQVVVGVASLLLQLRTNARREGAVAVAASFFLGLVVAMVATFLFIGPSRLLIGQARLWPLALASGAFLLLAPVLLGSVLGAFLRRA